MGQQVNLQFPYDCLLLLVAVGIAAPGNKSLFLSSSSWAFSWWNQTTGKNEINKWVVLLQISYLFIFESEGSFFFYSLFIYIFIIIIKTYGMLHEIACHPYAGARLIFSVLFHLQYMCCRSGHWKWSFFVIIIILIMLSLKALELDILIQISGIFLSLFQCWYLFFPSLI